MASRGPGDGRISVSAPRKLGRGDSQNEAGGVRIISTYIFWIHHEELEGQFDWSGGRDLHRFVALREAWDVCVGARRTWITARSQRRASRLGAAEKQNETE